MYVIQKVYQLPIFKHKLRKIKKVYIDIKITEINYNKILKHKYNVHKFIIKVFDQINNLSIKNLYEANIYKLENNNNYVITISCSNKDLKNLKYKLELLQEYNKYYTIDDIVNSYIEQILI